MNKSFKKGVPKAPPVKPKSYLDNMSNSDESFESKEEKKESTKPVSKSSKRKRKVDNSTQMSHKIDSDIFETLKDFVWTKRISGEPDYSQRLAIEEGLIQLFKTIDIVKRPKDK